MNKFPIGSVRNGLEVLPKDKRRTILFLSDDLRMTSGIAGISKQIVLGLCHRFNFMQVGAAINHPEHGKILDVSGDVQNQTGVEDAHVQILAWNGYGNPDLLRQLINSQRPDAILHFTDPRYWVWLYEMEHEVRQNVPILYYSIWDDLPDPLYNRNYYESCDWIGCISKQTYGIVKRLGSRTDKPTWKVKDDWQVSYVPHGIDGDVYKPTDVPEEFLDSVFGKGVRYDFVFFWSNRNIRRKQPADVIMAYKEFCSRLGEASKSTCLLMHTQIVDENGTDLRAVVRDLAPECNVVFSDKKRPVDELNYLYNIASCTINIAGNEGFGLTSAESVVAGTPIIVNVTGGLQDQCGFKDKNGKYLSEAEYISIGSLHDPYKWRGVMEYGAWCFPIWSAAMSLMGSVPTPYIWDDRINIHELSGIMLNVYELGVDELKFRGLIGRDAFLGELGLNVNNMCMGINDGIESTLKNWSPRKRYELFKLT